MSLLSHVARSLGWNPIGAAVNIKIDESSIPAFAGKELTATVAALEKKGAFLLALATPLIHEEKSIQKIIAYPRHKGYDIYHIAFGSIAVNLFFYPGDELQQWFALALIKRHTS